MLVILKIQEGRDEYREYLYLKIGGNFKNWKIPSKLLHFTRLINFTRIYDVK